MNWATFRDRFVDRTGRLVDNGNGGISHSEGQGYAMVLAVEADDRRTFDRLWRWTQRHLYNPATGLHAWRYDPKAARPVADANNATDGDILIAWALGTAASRWKAPALADAARVLRAHLLAQCVVRVADLQLLLPGVTGFVKGDVATVNPAYYIWPALDAFHTLAPGEGWDRLIGDGESLLSRARFGLDGLPTDWVDITLAGEVRPAEGREPRFGFDAVRVPLYAALGGRQALAAPAEQFWRRRLSQGVMLPAWVDVITGLQAPYAGSPGVMAIVARLLGLPKPGMLADDYYAAVLQLLANLRIDR